MPQRHQKLAPSTNSSKVELVEDRNQPLKYKDEIIRLTKEKEDSKHTIMKLKLEIEAMKSSYEKSHSLSESKKEDALKLLQDNENSGNVISQLRQQLVIARRTHESKEFEQRMKQVELMLEHSTKREKYLQSETELTSIIKGKGPGIVNIEMFKDLHDPSRNRGFLFVEYYNHPCADYARQKLSSSDFKVKTIYVKNLPENISKEKVKDLFEIHGEVTKIVLPHAKARHKRDFGFVHFTERSSALKAVKGSEKYEIDGQALEVSMAKPLGDKKPDHSSRPGGAPHYPLPPYGGGYMGDPYGAYGGGPRRGDRRDGGGRGGEGSRRYCPY